MSTPEIGGKQVFFRVFSGSPEETVANVNNSLDEWVVTMWNFAPGVDRVILTALMVAKREITKAQLSQIQPPSLSPRSSPGATQLGVINVNADTVPRQ